MSTLGDVITQVQFLLRSYTGQHERTTYLTNDVASNATALAVADGTVVDQGLIQIDDELMYVISSDAGSVSVPPFGRGYAGTTAAAHTTGAQVLVDPMFPRSAIAEAVDYTLREIYPRLFAVDTTELTMTSGVTSYEMPADADRVISASWQAAGGTGYWVPLKRWRFDNDASTSAYPSGKVLHISDAIPPGRTVRVVYAKEFGAFTDSSSTLTSVGLLESMKEVLVLGACWRLLQFLEVERLDLQSAENAERAQFAQPGNASQVAARVLALFERRLDQERNRLLQLHKMTIRFTR